MSLRKSEPDVMYSSPAKYKLGNQFLSPTSSEKK